VHRTIKDGVPLFFSGGPKYGWSWWNSYVLTNVFDLGIGLGGIAVYWLSTRPAGMGNQLVSALKTGTSLFSDSAFNLLWFLLASHHITFVWIDYVGMAQLPYYVRDIVLISFTLVTAAVAQYADSHRVPATVLGGKAL